MPIDLFDGSDSPCTNGAMLGAGSLTLNAGSGQANCTWTVQGLDAGVLVEVNHVGASGVSGFEAIAKLELHLTGGNILDLNLSEYQGSVQMTATSTVSVVAQPFDVNSRVWLLFEATDDRTVVCKATAAPDPAGAAWFDLGTSAFAPNTTMMPAMVTVEAQGAGNGSGSASAVFTNLETCL